MCDLVLLYLLPKREFYKNMKFKHTDAHAQVRPCSRPGVVPPADTRGQQRARAVTVEAGTDQPPAGYILMGTALVPMMGGIMGQSCMLKQQAPDQTLIESVSVERLWKFNCGLGTKKQKETIMTKMAQLQINTNAY